MLKKFIGTVPPRFKTGTRIDQEIETRGPGPVHLKWPAISKSSKRPGWRVLGQLLSNTDLQRIEDMVVMAARENAAQTLIDEYGREAAKRAGNGFLDGHPEFDSLARASVPDCMVEWYSREPRLTKKQGGLIEKRAEDRFWISKAEAKPTLTVKKASGRHRRFPGTKKAKK